MEPSCSIGYEPLAIALPNDNGIVGVEDSCLCRFRGDGGACRSAAACNSLADLGIGEIRVDTWGTFESSMLCRQTMGGAPEAVARPLCMDILEDKGCNGGAGYATTVEQGEIWAPEGQAYDADPGQAYVAEPGVAYISDRVTGADHSL